MPDRHWPHAVTKITARVVWVTKYRYAAPKRPIRERCRGLLVQICDAEDVRILSWVVTKDHVRMHVEYPPDTALSELVRKLKGRTSRKPQEEFPELSKRHWRKRFRRAGYGAWGTGNITDEMVQAYLGHHRNPSNEDYQNIMLE